MDYKKLAAAVKLCGSEPGAKRCAEECPYFNGTDMTKCIPIMTSDATTAITDLLARAEAEEARAEKYKFFFDDVSVKPNCNTCADLECTYRPNPGQIMRFNCPLWRGHKEE